MSGVAAVIMAVVDFTETGAEAMAKQTKDTSTAELLPSDIGERTGELETLRDLIFGNQARDFARRLGELDTRLEVIRKEFRSELDASFKSANKTSADRVLAVRKDVQVLAERLEQLSADTQDQFESLRKAIEVRMDQMQDDASARLRTLEEDSRQRDEELRAELLTVSGWLKDKMASRHDLGRMLEEVGQKLQAGDSATGQKAKDEV